MTGGKGSLDNLDDVTGAMCPAPDNTLKPCDNTPSVFSALVQYGALSAAQNMFSLYIAKNTAVNGKGMREEEVREGNHSANNLCPAAGSSRTESVSRLL